MRRHGAQVLISAGVDPAEMTMVHDGESDAGGQFLRSPAWDGLLRLRRRRRHLHDARGEK